MHRNFLACILCTATVFLFACGKDETPPAPVATAPAVETLDTIAEASIGELNKMTAAMAKVTDEASAKAAAPEIESISRQMKELDQRSEKFGQASQGMNEKYLKRLMDARNAMSDEERRIKLKDPEARKIVDAAIKKGEQPK